MKSSSSSRRSHLGVAIILVVIQLTISCASAVQDYPYKTIDLKHAGVNIDTSNISVSGISSGGYMAVQYHVAYSRYVKGAAVFAGGPWECTIEFASFLQFFFSCKLRSSFA
eukprot:TRINITY_DN439_c0_g1_i2.p2 TRINITY_DN439_c0_g1~~TRINITY_DN439_c0_g1_i2.p2  ORF type:complete len:111 (+),score=24.94 TRINITY_DN439_c0_g1_i2:162-494(+)